ncbi:helicase associated domain-containing protein [Streptomyces chartreusis]|uniref:helicase associated domain-containing protein n=1 Tax=Streptomyces chartreusis TaxID=1969 RepID=UPI003867F3BC
MVCSVADERFQENLAAARAYYEEHWTLCVPPRSATVLDRPVKQWLSSMRRPGALEDRPEKPWEPWPARQRLRPAEERWRPGIRSGAAGSERPC